MAPKRQMTKSFVLWFGGNFDITISMRLQRPFKER